MMSNGEQTYKALKASVLKALIASFDPDWEELVEPDNSGCSRKATMEVERHFREAEPNIDKFTPDVLHQSRFI
jgi:hypothetical protein